MSLVKNQMMSTGSTSARRRSSNSSRSNLNKSCYTPNSNNSSISSCDSNATPGGSYKVTSYVDSDLLETNIKEIEYTLLGLMDSEAAAANRNSQRLASMTNVRNKIYGGENSSRRARIGSITKNRKNSATSNMSPESIQGILTDSYSQNVSYDSYNIQQQQQLVQSNKYLCKENVDPIRQQTLPQCNLNDSIFLDTPPYFSSPESKSNQYSNYRDLNHLSTTILNNSNSALSINSVDQSSPRVYQNYPESFLNSPKLSPSPTPYRMKNGEIIMVKTPCYYENNFTNSKKAKHTFPTSYTNYNSQDGLNQANFCNSPQYSKNDLSFHSPNPSGSIDNFKSNSNMTGNCNNGKKSVKMSVPSNKRQILEEEFRKEKYPCNEKLQKLSNRLNMKYEEVQRYFKKRRSEEKETNNKFSNLVKLLNNYLETEE